MFKQYTYKQKFIALIALLILLSITAYKRSFSNLIVAYKEYKTLVNHSNEINNKSKNIQKISNDLYKYDSYLGGQNTTSDIVQQEIVDFATKHNGISISDLQSIHSFHSESYSAYTNQLDITGNANDLLKLLYDFETEFNFSKVVNSQFYKTKTNNSIERLHLKIVFQNYEINK